MYCIVVTGIPAAGKSTMEEKLSNALGIPWFSKDKMKEILFDTIGFQSREGKVTLGIISLQMMYYAAEQVMKQGQPLILENNFENISKEGLVRLLTQYHHKKITVVLTGDYSVIYERFVRRNNSPDRHRGHVVNDCYPEKEKKEIKPISYEDYVAAIRNRGMDQFSVGGAMIRVDATEFKRVNMTEIIKQIKEYLS